MSATTEPGRAIVSVWHEDVGSGKFLGSAAFITSRWVLTAAHVVSDKDKQPVAVVLGSVAGQTRVPVKPESIQCEFELDVALIDLGHEFSKQDFMRIDFRNRDLTEKKADFHAFNENSQAQDPHCSHTIGSLDLNRGGYLCDHLVLKGFSGGIAAINGSAVGVIIGRHKQDQQTLIIPAYQFHDWFREVLPSETLAEYFPAPSALPPVASRQVQTEFSALVRKKISELLGNSRLRPLKASLSDRLPEDGTVTDAVHVLVPPGTTFDIESSIDALHLATEACLEKARDDHPDVLPHLVAGATDILGWLVLLAVSEDWVQEGMVSLDQLREAQYIHLPIKSEAGTEVVTARLREQKANVQMDPNEGEACGKYRFSWGELEQGFHSEDSITEVVKLIFKKVFKSDPPIPFDAYQQERLAATLEKRKRGKNPENYYIALHADSPYVNSLSGLRSKLPDLDLFLIGTSDGEHVLVIEEHRLQVLIEEFLLMCRKYP